jgi:hypothetical protein
MCVFENVEKCKFLSRLDTLPAGMPDFPLLQPVGMARFPPRKNVAAVPQ